MARAYIELPAGWGPGRVIITAVQAAGYDCEEHRMLSTGERFLALHSRAAVRRSQAAAPPHEHAADGS